MPNRITLIWAILLQIVLPSCTNQHAQIQDTISQTSLGVPGVHGGVVATSEPRATKAGIRILKQGGNAIDAAAAVAFALNVVEPHSSGIGGGGFMMIFLAEPGKTVVVDSRETAPSAADPPMFLDSRREPFPFDIRSTSGVAVGVPGMVRGIEYALGTWGTMSLANILAPAIELATKGFRISQYLEDHIREGLNGGRLSNEQGNPSYDMARSIFAPSGVPLKHGDMLVQPDLARTFRLLADKGPDTFYTGDIAQAIVTTQQYARTIPSTEDAPRLQGRMTVADLSAYTAVVRQPVEAHYRGYRITSTPPPSSGGLTVLQILKLLERFPLGDFTQGFGLGATRTLHLMLEAMRLAFADRAVWMGDADKVAVPINGLLHHDYIATRTTLISLEDRQQRATPGNPLPYEGSTKTPVTHIQSSSATFQEGTNTTHFTIIDELGNIVTYTNTIESAWGTGLMVPGYGFLLNNELTDFNPVPTFNADPHHYNPGANDVAPGKRPRSSMAPTLIFHHEKPIAAYGSPGGATIINSVVNIALNLIDHHLNIQESVDVPRISQTTTNGRLIFEAGFSLDVVNALRTLGHDLTDTHLSRIGSVQAVAIDEMTKLRYGAADRRRPGSVMSLR